MPISPGLELFTAEEAHLVLEAFYQELGQQPPPEVPPVVFASGMRGTATRARAPWEQALRADFIARYGPPLLPMPEVLERSPLFMALKLSPRYMVPGIRDAARAMFTSPIFLASIALSIVVYLAAWVVPEPLFSKAAVAAFTLRMAMVVGVLELRNVARACIQLYRDAAAARTLPELEAVAERFGRALGGTALRVLVMAASFGASKALPTTSARGLGALMGPPRYAVAGGVTMGSAATAQVMADGTLIVTGAAVGTAASGASADNVCSDGSRRKEGHQWHHLATDKNLISAARGGPWTPRFEDIFALAGMSLDDPANRIYLRAHQGPHPEEYHSEVYKRLQAAIAGCRPQQHCRSKLAEELTRIAREVCTRGSRLHQLLTGGE